MRGRPETIHRSDRRFACPIAVAKTQAASFDSLPSEPVAIITDEFIDKVVRTGDFAKALERVRNGSAAPLLPGYASFGTWSLICEDMLDTEHPPEHYDRIVAELQRRRIEPDEMLRMLWFAWRTAGWLNFDRVLWEWCRLDEKEIRVALDLQLREGLISAEQHSESMSYVERYAGDFGNAENSSPA